MDEECGDFAFAGLIQAFEAGLVSGCFLGIADFQAHDFAPFAIHRHIEFGHRSRHALPKDFESGGNINLLPGLDAFGRASK